MDLAQHYIDGAFSSDPASGVYQSIDPANGIALGAAARGSPTQAHAAVAAARHAFETSTWSGDIRLRYGVLMNFAANMRARENELATLLSRENGKPIAQARHEVNAAIVEAEYYAGLARAINGRTLESKPNAFSFFLREPAGVVAVIVPWNAPATLLVRSLAPALAAGCTCVIKPAPQTPLINAALMECLAAIDDLPNGVVNSVNENGIEIGTVLATHPEVDVITFTGSSRTGKIVMEKAAPTLKRLSLELGGKSPGVVFADADLDKTVAEIARATITLNGQMCTCISRVLVDRSIETALIEGLKQAFASVKMGHPLEPTTTLGPLIDRPNQERAIGLIDMAVSQADVLLKGEPGTGDLAAGSIVSPTMFRIQDTTSPLVQNEHFIPMISVEPFGDEVEAIEKSNATRFGLAASVYTNDLNRAMRVSRAIRTGTVWLNSHNRHMAEAETGGYRESGMGRLHGPEALHDFLETKHIYLEAGNA
ncbi:MAG: aldehyde dehydrogenase family protein [Pseudomonadota bacterium]